MAENTYDKYKTHANKKMTSTYLLTPKICMDAATPANSATTFARSTKKPVIITKNVGRNPNSSRMRSDRPFPVTTPIRAHISSVTYSAMFMGMRDQCSAEL